MASATFALSASASPGTRCRSVAPGRNRAGIAAVMTAAPRRATGARATARSAPRRSAPGVAAAASLASEAAPALDLPPCETDANGIERLVLREEGWRRWTWQGHDCHYISAGTDNSGPIVVLVHGFGAHSYHWRYTIPMLTRKGCRVYALCMLGYGWSPKADAEYCMELWGQQVMDFTREVAKAGPEDKAVIAGNSIGALAALYAAAEGQEQCKGLCLVNAAGNFEPGAPPGPEKKTAAQKAMGMVDTSAGAKESPTLRQRLGELFGRATATGIFYFTKIRIKQILQQVYEFDVDDELVKSIDMAAEDEGALSAFYQISLAGGRTQARPRDLLRSFDGPVMLLWGEKDPWMTPSKASRIMELKPSAFYKPVLAGHCPQDDAPVEANEALADWLFSLPAGNAQ